MAQKQEYDYLFKILLIGNTFVGKSSLLQRFIDQSWNGKFDPTIGVDFVRIIKNKKIQKLKTIEVEGKKVKLQIWDTAGEERFRNITSSYYKGGHGILLMYDITNRNSFESIKNWLIEVEKHADKNIYKILIGNKIDLEKDRDITYNEGKEYAESEGMKFIETSAKDGSNIEEAFELITKEIIKSNINKNVNEIENKNNSKINLGDNIEFKPKKKCC